MKKHPQKCNYTVQPTTEIPQKHTNNIIFETKLIMKMPPNNRLLPNFGHALVEYNNMRFLIMDRPSKANIGQFVEVII